MTGWGDGNGGTQRRKDAMKSGFPQHPAVIPGVPPVIAGVLPSLPRRRESGGGREGFRRGVVLGRLWRLRVRYLVRGRRLRRLSVGSRRRGMRLGWPTLLRG